MHPSVERLANLLGVTALAAADRLRAAIGAELARTGSAPAVLVHLQAYPGESVVRLQAVLGISQPATVRVVGALVADDLVERHPGRNRRTLALYLTEAGEAAARAVLAERAIALEAMVATLDPADRERLEGLLERIVTRLADDRPTALHVCRMCDRGACRRAPGCPLDHTVKRRARRPPAR
jgi:MarR family transcriptional repressor of emrRAB